MEFACMDIRRSQYSFEQLSRLCTVELNVVNGSDHAAQGVHGVLGPAASHCVQVARLLPSRLRRTWAAVVTLDSDVVVATAV